MSLASEDSFRLNVLLANNPLAIRVDESAMVVCGLTEQGEVRVKLNPVGRDDLYLRRVRELLSGHVTGSPGGYPVFLKRWTRMGQMRDESLAQMLLLGEPEAVVAAACAPGITDELARRAWWAMEDAENARRMLGSAVVVQGGMGKVLARYLIDYLPFETETEKMMETVRLVLQPGLLDEAKRQELWKKSARKQAYQVGFLAADPDALPVPAPPHPDLQRGETDLAELANRGNPVAVMLLKVLSGPGQAFVQTAQGVLGKPPTQDVVTAALDAVRAYFALLRPEGDPDRTVEALQRDAAAFSGPQGAADALACVETSQRYSEPVRAMRLLSGVGYGVVRPVFRDSTAVGSLMRRKLQPVLGPVSQALECLLSRL